MTDLIDEFTSTEDLRAGRRRELERQSKEYLIELVISLEARLDDDTLNMGRPTGKRPFDLPWEPRGYVRLPEGAAQGDVQDIHRITLISFDLSHPVVGIEISGDAILGRASGGTVPDFDLSEFDGRRYGVSRQHAMLRPTPEGVVLIDLGSSNGTRVNAEGLEPDVPQLLAHNDIVEFGGLKFQVRMEGRRV